ncbi:hypothetical protein [Mycobacteroides abscessus]|uniref:hypothetical protein n=1 Tax=Mycobacteroides abscessus TaxID=36809 RepID=UPI001F5FF4FD|nr:hypothetical protein [Mycobacteroides abscessus]
MGLDPEECGRFQLDQGPPLPGGCARCSDDAFKTKTRGRVDEIFIGTDACVSPVLTWGEAKQNEHLRDRGTIVGRGRW